MTDTPETDRQDTVITKPRRTEWVSKEFARRIERERDEARTRLRALRDRLNPNNHNEIGTGIMERLLTSVGKSFIMLGFGNARLVEKVKTKELVLWSISQSKGHPDKFTKGWSGCDPGQLYFVENTEPNAPKNNLLLGVERMSEAQCSSPSTPGGDLTADEPQYDWRARHDSYLKYLYVENPPNLVWNGEEWIPETNA